MPVRSKEDVQTSRTLSPLTLEEAVPQTAPAPAFRNSSAVSGLHPCFDQGHDSNVIVSPDDSTSRCELENQSRWTSQGGAQPVDVQTTPRKQKAHPHRQVNIGFYSEPLEVVPDDLKSPPSATIPKPKHHEQRRQPELEMIACDTCQAVDKVYTRTRMSPCGVSDLISPHLP